MGVAAFMAGVDAELDGDGLGAQALGAAGSFFVTSRASPATGLSWEASMPSIASWV